MGKSDSAEKKIKDKLMLRIPLVATLCLVLGMFMYTSPTYAESTVNVDIRSLGNAKSAAVFVHGQQVGTCVLGSALIAMGVTGRGMFSVNFFSSSDCSGKRKTPVFRFSAPQGRSGIFRVTCQSDTDCKEGYG
jgi:hypothetical protein